MIQIQAFFDPTTFTLTYVVHRKGHKECVVIDPVLDYDAALGRLHTDSLDTVCIYLQGAGLEPKLCLETHAHADHLSAAQILKQRYPETKVAISARITQVQAQFIKQFNFSDQADGRDFDLLLTEGEVFGPESLRFKELSTPGHTPACSCFLIEDAVFTGDTLFMPDSGVGRCDFPGGSAQNLYRSIKEQLYTLPDDTRVFVGHDYQPNGRKLRYQSTIGEQKATNVFIADALSEQEFVDRRQARDAQLKPPKLLLPSIQVNIFAGRLPEQEENGLRYLKLPVVS